MKVTAAVASAAVVVACAAPLGEAAVQAPGSAFVLPSRNIACLYLPAARSIGPASLRCDILSGLRPEPRRRCELDWTGVAMRAGTRAAPQCAGDTVYDRSAPVLRYGRSWHRGAFRCVSRRAGLTCRNAAGHGFFLARTRWRTW